MELNFSWKFDTKNLQDVSSMKADIEKAAGDLKIGRTKFMEKNGVSSEREYKERMMKEGVVMKHSAIGYNTWETTEEAVRTVFNTLKENGSYITRYGVCMDWVMGVPEEFRDRMQPGSGAILKNEKEWMAIGQIEAVQPHLGDHMIGSLNSLYNVKNGLKAGVTTIGNFSHYYTYEYPGFDMDEYRTNNMCKGLLLMAKFRDKGTIVHSNLDDGFGAQFQDMANLVGYAKLERYIAEELLGARMGHCFGNLFNDPMVRIIFNVAMSKINTYKTPGSMIYGNTIDFGYNMHRNYANLTSYSMADAIGQLLCPTGHAITPIPITEAIRIPNVEEIIEAHNTVDMAIEQAHYYKDFIDYSAVEAEAELLVACGNVFFERVLNALDDHHVDINHPGEMLAALKAIGPAQLETNFGSGERKAGAMRGRVPVRSTSIVKEIGKQQNFIMGEIKDLDKKPLKGVNLIVASTDVHEFGKEICKNLMIEAGANVFDLGTTVSVDEVADAVIETESRAILISTFNGMAYSFGKAMVGKLEEINVKVPFVMGGRLNEPMDGNDVPVDVSDRLSDMGINTDNDMQKIVDYLQEALNLGKN